MEHPCASQSTKGRTRGDKVQFFLFVFCFVFPGVAFVLDCLSYFV